MPTRTTPSCPTVRFRSLTLIGFTFIGLTVSLRAQAPTPPAGEKAVCSTGGCSQADLESSSAIIDASAVSSSTSTICGQIGAAYGELPPAGGVIDARGVPGQSGLSLICKSNETPWSTLKTIPPATILLPVGTITMSLSWVLPNQTRLIGVGTGTTNCPLGTCYATTITNSSTTGYMLTMGSSSFCASGCTGITIENLTLTTSSTNVGGIQNQYAGQGSYVSHVGMNGVQGIGLQVTNPSSGPVYSQNSGPYSDISFNVSGGTAKTTCIQILNVGGTKGIHRITCNSGNTSAQAAIELDSSSNSVEDVLITGFQDGILIGANGSAQGNSIINVTDATPSTQDEATIYISSNYTVTDLSITGINNSCSGTGCHSYTLVDNVGQINLLATTDPNLGMYVIGSNSAGFAFGRFTTSPSAPSWTVGSLAPSPKSPCTRGSIYSNTGGSPGSLWVCALLSGVATWQVVLASE